MRRVRAAAVKSLSGVAGLNWMGTTAWMREVEQPRSGCREHSETHLTALKITKVALVFNKFQKKEKYRVFLGALAVAPRTDFKRHRDQWGIFQTEDLDAGLRQSLKEIFPFPLATEVKELKDNDLGLDVVVVKFQSGDALVFSLGEFEIPILWRPKVMVSSRLYYLISDKTKDTFSITEKMKWNQYLGRMLSWRALFRFRPIFDSKDMNYLLCLACHNLLVKMQKSI